jgi:hypothetical protein
MAITTRGSEIARSRTAEVEAVRGMATVPHQIPVIDDFIDIRNIFSFK